MQAKVGLLNHSHKIPLRLLCNTQAKKCMEFEKMYFKSSNSHVAERWNNAHQVGPADIWIQAAIKSYLCVFANVA